MPLRKKFYEFKYLVQDAADKGMLLFLAAVLALLISNSAFADFYNALFHGYFKLYFEDEVIEFTLHHVINDVFMVAFFFLVGLEIKREVLQGHLSQPSQRTLPAWCAVGGVIFPAAIYYLINIQSSEIAAQGWAIPAATDIAFALGVFAFFGKCLPTSLRIFLTALAIIDDLMAVLIIALFYSSGIDLIYIGMIACICVVLYIINRKQVSHWLVYGVFGLVLWYLFLSAGVHTTVAGVLLAMFVPLKVSKSKESPLKSFEHALHPVVAYLILPIFAFANSGVALDGASSQLLTHSVTLGIILGLLIGKQVGIFGVGYILVKLKKAKLPEGANMMQFYAVSIMCGIGFTMSLFIGELAFDGSDDYTAQVKVGVLLGSLLSVLLSVVMIKLSLRKK